MELLTGARLTCLALSSCPLCWESRWAPGTAFRWENSNGALGQLWEYEAVSPILRALWLQFRGWKKSRDKLGAPTLRLYMCVTNPFYPAINPNLRQIKWSPAQQQLQPATHCAGSLV